MKPPTGNAGANAPNMDSLSVRGLFVTCRNCGHKTAIDVDAWPYHVPMTSFGPRTVLQPVRQPWRYSDTELDRAAGQAAGGPTTGTGSRPRARQRLGLARAAPDGQDGVRHEVLCRC